MKRQCPGLLVTAMAACFAAAASGQQPSIATALTNRCAWGANIGWINARPNPVDGAVIGEYVCWGYLYAGNIGWIRLGTGMPTNGYRYSNESHTDWGVNHDGLGNLRGLAWSANAGWIQFEDTGGPSVNLVNGDLSGYAWGANIGWISLSNQQGAVRTLWLDSGPDTDGNGIPDAYEYMWVGNTGIFTAVSQSDSDGISDKDEYTMGTCPTNGDSYLRILNLAQAGAPNTMDVTWTTERRRHYYLDIGPAVTDGAPWFDSGLGLLVPGGSVMTRPVYYGSLTQMFWRVRPVVPLAR